MGSSQQAIKVAVIDLRSLPKDFAAISQNKLFSCNYYDSYDKFLENQSLKELSYIIIRQKKQQLEQQHQWKDKIRESSVVAKTYQNMCELESEFRKEKEKRQPLLRQRLIAYIRKYSLQRLVIYLLVDNVLDFKIPEYQQPYITLVADKIEVIKNHLEQKPKGAQPLNFKFRRLVKDLYRRTVVKILNTQTDKEIIKRNKEEWTKCLAPKITPSITNFNEEQFQENLMSNYFQYIVVSNSTTLSFIQDMKRKHKFESLLIYYGKIEDYGKQEYSTQTEQKINQIKKSLWMHSQSISQICQAVKNCTDIVAEETSVRAKNVVIYTHLKYGALNQSFFVSKLAQLLNSSTLKNNDANDKQWIKDLSFKVINNLDQLKVEIKKATFSYLITFDCIISEIEVIKAFLRQEKLHKRAYMYNAEEKENAIDQIKLNVNNDQKIKQYLSARAKKVLEKAGFMIRFEIGPIDEITTYKASEKQLMYFRYELGLQTENIQSSNDFQKYYLSSNREKIILGFCMIMKVKDYKEYKDLVLKELEKDTSSYLRKIKIIILDQVRVIQQYWSQLKSEIEKEKIVFVHYNLTKVSEFLDIFYVPGINLSIFVKKALPNLYKAYQKVEESKFKRVELTGSIVSKNQLLKEVFGDENFKLSTQYDISFLKLANTNKNLQQALVVLHEQFLVRYGTMWRTGHQIFSKAKKQRCLLTLKDDIKACLFKCKAYQLLQVSEQEFEYFYLKRLDQCQTYLDLQITIIYMFSLPHGLSSVIQLIFRQGISTCLSPKIFSALLVILLSAFCSFQDEVMNKKRLVIYLDQTNNQQFNSIISSLKIGDILFNSCFILSGGDQASHQNAKNNCLFLQFENIPMLSQTHIKNYLYIERFSFYKESTQYLVAPYTQFTVKNIDVSPMGKTHITLIATPESKKGLVSKVFDSNNIKESQLFECIISEVKGTKNAFSAQESKRIKQTGSLYKKAELIGLYQEKIELTKSIREGFEYNNFLIAARMKKYMTALSHIKKKEVLEKSTTQIQATYFKKMLGVEKAMLYYHLCEYDMSMKELDKVIVYLEEQNVEESQNWVIKKVKAYKQSVSQLNTKRQKYLNRSQKTKHWKIQPQIIKNQNSVKLGVKMSSKKMSWNVGYDPQLQQFYIQSTQSERLFHYNIKPAFGQLSTVFPPNSSYQKISDRKAHQKDLLHHNVEKQMSADVEEQKRQKSSKKPRKNSQKQLQNKRNSNGMAHKIQKQPSALTLPKKQASPKKQERNQPTESKVIDNVKENKNQHLEVPQKQQKHQKSSAEVLPSQNPKKHQQPSNSSHIRQSSPEKVITESELRMGVREHLDWQAFFFDGKFLLTQKGKHYKTKVPNKHNL